MKLNDSVIIIFKNDNNEKLEIEITVDKLLDCNRCDLYEMLEDTSSCNCSSCNNESQNFCDCGPHYDDYEIVEILMKNR